MDKANIIFLKANDRSALFINVKYLYSIQKYISDNVSILLYNNDPENNGSKLLALGVLLIRININQLFKSLQLSGNLVPNNKPNEMTNLQVSQKWVLEQKNKGDLTFIFYSIISHYLKCFVDSIASLQNSKFCKAVKKQVLILLEEPSFLFDLITH